MKKTVKQILSALLVVVMLLSSVPVSDVAFEVSAASFNDINQPGVFVKQQTNYTCTLASAVMLVRRTAMAAGNNNWSSITESSMRGTAWKEGSGLWYNFTYAGVSVGHGNISGDIRLFYIDLLKKYPQGVVAYNPGWNNQYHAILLTDYDSMRDVFYCADPANGTAGGRIPISSSSIKGQGANGQNDKLSVLTEYWYVKSPSVSITNIQIPTQTITPVDGGVYKIVSAVGSDKYLDFACTSNNVQIYENCDNHSNPDFVKSQYFKIISCGNGWYQIINTGNNQAVDVAGASAISGTNIWQWQPIVYSAQQFRFLDAGDGYCYIESLLGTFVDVQNATNANNTNVQAYEFNGTNAQKWKLVSHSHSNTSKVTKNATCTSNGTKTHTCSKCGISSTENIPATGHKYGDWVTVTAANCVTAGSQKRTCSACGNAETKTIAAGGHKLGEWATATAATCTAAGTQKAKCTLCGKEETKSVPALGHDYKTEDAPANCKQYAGKKYTCKRCNHSYTEEGKKTYSEWSTTPPQNIDKSLIETKTQYRYSDYQTKTSYDSSLSGYKLIKSEWVKEKTENKKFVSSWPSGYPSTSTFRDKYTGSRVESSENATTKVVAENPTVYGYIYYHYCRNTYANGPINRKTSKTKTSEFKKFHGFSSATNPNTLTAADDGSRTFPKADLCKDSHWYYPFEIYTQNYTTYKKLNTFERWTDFSAWSDTAVQSSNTRKVETRTIYRYVTSKLGNHVEVGVAGKSATCTVKGLTEGKKCSVCGTVTVAQTETPATGHKEVAVPGKAATCTAKGLTEGKKCSVCGTVTVAQTETPATGHKEVAVPGKAATCTVKGLTEGKKCSICGKVTVAQTEIPATGHKEVAVPGKAATCTVKGLTEGKKCSVCGTVTVAQKEIPATGHKAVIISGVPATTEATGLTDGEKCSACGMILKAQQTIAKLEKPTEDNKEDTTKPENTPDKEETENTEHESKLGKVKSLKVKKTTVSSIKLSWKKVEGAEKYKVYYSTNGKKWKSKTTSKTTYTIKRLVSGQSYQLKVKAIAGEVEGEISDIRKTATRVDEAILDSVKSSKLSQAVVKWDRTDGASGYVVEYSTSKKFTKKTTKKVTIKKGKTTKTTLKKLKSGKKYYVRIKAYKTVNKKAVYGAYSSVKTVKVK